MADSTVERQVCANCGKKAPRRMNQTWLAFGETYQGDERVVSTQRQETYEEYLERTSCCFRVSRESWERQMRSPFRRWIVRTWDGESYQPLPFGAFCTMRCGFEYGQAAAEKAHAE